MLLANNNSLGDAISPKYCSKEDNSQQLNTMIQEHITPQVNNVINFIMSGINNVFHFGIAFSGSGNS